MSQINHENMCKIGASETFTVDEIIFTTCNKNHTFNNIIYYIKEVGIFNKKTNSSFFF